MMLSDVCHVHREYSWRPQLLEARRAGRRRPGVRRVWAEAGLQHEYSWRPQLLEARRAGRRRPGVRRVCAGAGPQRAAYMGGGISWRPPTYSLLACVMSVVYKFVTIAKY